MPIAAMALLMPLYLSANSRAGLEFGINGGGSQYISARLHFAPAREGQSMMVMLIL
jgi:hypothetical protein